MISKIHRKRIYLYILGYIVVGALLVRLFGVSHTPAVYAQEEDSEKNETNNRFLSSFASKLYCGIRNFFGGANSVNVCTETKPLDQAVLDTSSEPKTTEDTQRSPVITNTTNTVPVTRQDPPIFSPTVTPLSGISRDYVDSAINNLKLTLLPEIERAKNSPISYSVPDPVNYLPLSGGTLSGTLAVSGATTFSGVPYTWPSSDGSSGQVLSTDGSGTLSWATASGGGGGFSGGELEAEFITATSTTATSTFAHSISIATDEEYRINGVGLLTRTSAGAVVLGDVSGNARGTQALDIQASRGAITEVASGNYSAVVGSYSAYLSKANSATGTEAAAFGVGNTAGGDYSSAFGWGNEATGYESSAFGYASKATGRFDVAIGWGNYATSNNIVGWDGSNIAVGVSNYATGGEQASAFGYNNTASGNEASAFGIYNTASAWEGSSAFGYYNGAYDIQSSAFGNSNTASATSSSAFGRSNTASSDFSSAFGYNNTASGYSSSAFGTGNTASGWLSNTFGYYNTASNDSSSVFGHNITNAIATSTMIGPSDAAKLTILSTGEVQGSFFTATSTTATSTFANHISIATDKEYRINGVGILTRVSATGAVLGGDLSGNARGTGALDIQTTGGSATQVASGARSVALGSYAGYTNNANSATGTESSAVGVGNQALHDYAQAFGWANDVLGEYSSAFGVGNIAGTTTPNWRSASAFGYYNTAYGHDSSAFGHYNETPGDYSSAFGFYNVASGEESSAFGYYNIASGEQSSAFGHYNETPGDYASAFGYRNTASAYLTSAFGYGNTVSSSGASAFGSYITNAIATSTMVGPTDAAKLTILGASGSVGFVGIGTTTPQYLLHAVRTDGGAVAAFTDSDGTCTVDPTSTALVCSSDERLKKNITTLGSSLKTLNLLNPVEYNWKNDGSSEEKKVGFIAQQVQKLFPQLVSEQESGYLALNYTGLIPTIVKSIQELDAKVNLLSATASVGGVTSLGNNLITGVMQFVEIVAKKITADRIHTKELCIDDECIDSNELRQLLRSVDQTPESNSGGGGSGGNSEEEVVEEEEVTKEEIEESNEEEIAEDEPVETEEVEEGSEEVVEVEEEVTEEEPEEEIVEDEPVEDSASEEVVETAE